MKKYLLIALVLIFGSCDKPEIEEAINNIPDTEAQIVYSAKMINPAGTASASDASVKLTFRNNEGYSQGGGTGPTGGTIPNNFTYAYPLKFELGKKKPASLQIESNLFAKGWTIEADITKVTNSGGTVSLKKQTLTANGEISVLSID